MKILNQNEIGQISGGNSDACPSYPESTYNCEVTIGGTKNANKFSLNEISMLESFCKLDETKEISYNCQSNYCNDGYLQDTKLPGNGTYMINGKIDCMAIGQ